MLYRDTTKSVGRRVQDADHQWLEPEESSYFGSKTDDMISTHLVPFNATAFLSLKVYANWKVMR